MTGQNLFYLCTGQMQPTPAQSLGYLSPSSHQLAASSSSTYSSYTNCQAAFPAGATGAAAPSPTPNSSNLAAAAAGTAGIAIRQQQRQQGSGSCSGGANGASYSMPNGNSSSSSMMNGGASHTNGCSSSTSSGSSGTGSSSSATGSSSSAVCNGMGCNSGRSGAQAVANGTSSSNRGSGEWWLQLHLGQPPADTAVLAPLMAALQELQVRGGYSGAGGREGGLRDQVDLAVSDETPLRAR
jgi:hypothetical protein